MPNDKKLSGLSGLHPASVNPFHDESHATAEDAFSGLSNPTSQPTAKKAMDAANHGDVVLAIPSTKIATDTKATGLAASQHRLRFQMSTLSSWVKSQQPSDNDGYKTFKENANIQMHNLITELDGVNGVSRQITTKS